MQEGVISNTLEDRIAEFIVNDGYEPFNVLPMSCVLSGSRAYGLNAGKSDRDYLGVHLMDTLYCLEHPDFRPRAQVIRKRFNLVDGDIEEVVEGIKGGDISLDSFEIWKFMTMFLKGSFVVYELLYMPGVHHDPGTEGIFSLMREGITNKIGRVAKGNCAHDWRKDRTNRKKAMMAYYRLLQAIFFLREEEFEWRQEVLFDYIKPDTLTETGRAIRDMYLKPELRKTSLSEKEVIFISEEMERLVTEVDKAMIVTRLPDAVNRKLMKEIRERVVHVRSNLM